jgi:hypothetical protein
MEAGGDSLMLGPGFKEMIIEYWTTVNSYSKQFNLYIYTVNLYIKMLEIWGQ